MPKGDTGGFDPSSWGWDREGVSGCTLGHGELMRGHRAGTDMSPEVGPQHHLPCCSGVAATGWAGGRSCRAVSGGQGVTGRTQKPSLRRTGVTGVEGNGGGREAHGPCSVG